MHLLIANILEGKKNDIGCIWLEGAEGEGES